MHDQSTEMVNGIRAYLQVHFPGVEFIATDDVKKKSLLLHAGGQPRYRLLVSQRFLQADEGVVPARRMGSREGHSRIQEQARDARDDGSRYPRAGSMATVVLTPVKELRSETSSFDSAQHPSA